VTPAGFEPTTHSLEGCCSIQLSYGASNGLAKIGNLFYFGKDRMPVNSYSIMILIGILSFIMKLLVSRKENHITFSNKTD
jgi:hypothetical protein